MTTEVTVNGVKKLLEIDDEERTEVEVWSRVMGYYRPVSDWNAGKKQEYLERRLFNMPDFAKSAP